MYLKVYSAKGRVSAMKKLSIAVKDFKGKKFDLDAVKGTNTLLNTLPVFFVE